MIWGELFGGGGGVATGLEAAGHQIAWTVENDPVIASCYQANHPDTHVIIQDVYEVDVTSLAPVQGLWLSPVCKQHSKARNKLLPAREDATIGLAAIKYIKHLKPDLVILENVRGYMQHPSLATIIAFLSKEYTLSLKVIDAADYGVPQTRERLILQARKGAIAWPEQTEKAISWYEAIEDLLPTLTKGQLAPWQRKLWKAEYDEILPVMVHGNYDYHSNLEQERSLDIRPHYLPSRTVTASHNVTQRYIVTEQCILKPSIQAIARLQTFPDCYKWPTSMVKAIEIIGNAVPCLLAQKLAEGYRS